MGVGVYHSDFGGRGAAFLVDGPLGDEVDFKRHQEAAVAEGLQAGNREDWGQQEHDDAESRISESIVAALRPLNFNEPVGRGRRGGRAPFDSEFVGLGDDGMLAVGWRSWETDFVVAVGPTERAGRMLDCEGDEAFTELGRTQDGFKTDYDAAVSALDEYVRLHLIQDNHECRYRTSGYTTAKYEVPADSAVTTERLRHVEKDVRISLARISQSREEALSSLSDSERDVLIAMVSKAGGKIAFPVADRKDNCVSLYAPSDPEEDRGGRILATMIVPPELKDWFDALPVDAFVAVPREAATEAWFKARQGHPREINFVVSADEIARATGDDVSVMIHPSDKDPNLTTQVRMAHAPAHAPQP